MQCCHVYQFRSLCDCAVNVLVSYFGALKFEFCLYPVSWLIPLQFPYSLNSIPIQFPYSLNSIPIQFPYCLNSIPLQFPYCLNSIPIQFPYCLNSIPLQFPYSLNSIPIQFPYSLNSIPLQFPYSLNSIPIQFPYCLHSILLQFPNIHTATWLSLHTSEYRIQAFITPFNAALQTLWKQPWIMNKWMSEAKNQFIDLCLGVSQSKCSVL
jgi:hypothetical protein